MFSRWQRWNCHANKLQDLKVFLLQVSTCSMGGLFSFSPWTVFIVRGKNIVEKSKINVFKSFQSECNTPCCVSVLSHTEMLWFTQVLPEEISLIASWQMGSDSLELAKSIYVTSGDLCKFSLWRSWWRRELNTPASQMQYKSQLKLIREAISCYILLSRSIKQV